MAEGLLPLQNKVNNRDKNGEMIYPSKYKRLVTLFCVIHTTSTINWGTANVYELLILTYVITLKIFYTFSYYTS